MTIPLIQRFPIILCVFQLSTFPFLSGNLGSRRGSSDLRKVGVGKGQIKYGT